MQLRRVLIVLLVAYCLTGIKTAAQNDPFDFGKEWNGWPEMLREVYIEGFRDGQVHTYLEIADDLPSDRKETFRRASFLLYKASALRAVITSLYADPANTYITFDAMLYIARDKLSGTDVEPMLRDSRKHDRAYAHPPQ